MIQDWLRGRLTCGIPTDAPAAVRLGLESLAARLAQTTTTLEVRTLAAELATNLDGWLLDTKLRAYFLGGVDSLRGFLQDQVIPQDQVDLIDSERLAESARPRSI